MIKNTLIDIYKYLYEFCENNLSDYNILKLLSGIDFIR